MSCRPLALARTSVIFLSRVLGHVALLAKSLDSIHPRSSTGVFLHHKRDSTTRRLQRSLGSCTIPSAFSTSSTTGPYDDGAAPPSRSQKHDKRLAPATGPASGSGVVLDNLTARLSSVTRVLMLLRIKRHERQMSAIDEAAPRPWCHFSETHNRQRRPESIRPSGQGTTFFVSSSSSSAPSVSRLLASILSTATRMLCSLWWIRTQSNHKRDLAQSSHGALDSNDSHSVSEALECAIHGRPDYSPRRRPKMGSSSRVQTVVTNPHAWTRRQGCRLPHFAAAVRGRRQRNAYLAPWRSQKRDRFVSTSLSLSISEHS